jgi:hypothetical protein
MASNKKKPADQKPEDEVIDGQEQVSDEAPEESAADADGQVDDVSSSEDSDAPIVASASVAQPTDLHGRLTKAVKALSPHAGQEKTFALHQLELLTGRLKMAIPAGIAATEDDDLRSGLEAVLALL